MPWQTKPPKQKYCIYKQLLAKHVCRRTGYDKRNVEGLEGASEIILAELTKQVHQIFPDAEVRVKPMQANCLNSDTNKSDRENLNR